MLERNTQAQTRLLSTEVDSLFVLLKTNNKINYKNIKRCLGNRCVITTNDTTALTDEGINKRINFKCNTYCYQCRHC